MKNEGTVSTVGWAIGLPWVLTIAYMALIFLLSAQSHVSLPRGFSGYGFFLHTVEYGILGFLLSWALNDSAKTSGRLLYVMAIGLSYGISDELHQYFVPGRIASVTDVLADLLGLILGNCVLHQLWPITHGR